MTAVGQNKLKISKNMLHKIHKKKMQPWQDHAHIFAALGNNIRLSILVKLFDGQLHSIAQLTEGSKMTRQAITKHLLILENAKIVISVRSGRESLYQFVPETVDKIRAYLDYVSAQWDQTLLRLKDFVEK